MPQRAPTRRDGVGARRDGVGARRDGVGARRDGVGAAAPRFATRREPRRTGANQSRARPVVARAHNVIDPVEHFFHSLFLR